MKPHDFDSAKHEWRDPYSYCPALAPVRKPLPKRSRRARIKTRAMKLARQLKSAGERKDTT